MAKEKEKTGIGEMLLRPIIIIVVAVLASVLYAIYGDVRFTNLVRERRDFLRLNREELGQYDGSDVEKPIYLSIKGRIYDVSASPHYYGLHGGYGYFSGRDGSRSYVTGCFKVGCRTDLKDLKENQIKEIEKWVDFYEKSDKYFFVGTLVDYDPLEERKSVALPKDIEQNQNVGANSLNI